MVITMFISINTQAGFLSKAWDKSGGKVVAEVNRFKNDVTDEYDRFKDRFTTEIDRVDENLHTHIRNWGKGGEKWARELRDWISEHNDQVGEGTATTIDANGMKVTRLLWDVNVAGDHIYARPIEYGLATYRNTYIFDKTRMEKYELKKLASKIRHPYAHDTWVTVWEITYFNYVPLFS